jgi:adenylosuccinate synthase
MKMQKNHILYGLGWGDESKGETTDWFCREDGNKTVVRYNGAPQAGHFVEPYPGMYHCFAQLGSGSFNRGVDTYLSRHMMVELEMLQKEAEVFRGKIGGPDPLRRVYISDQSNIITPMHKMRNQMKEIARGVNRHGSCGQGVGEAAFDRRDGLGITINDALDLPLLTAKLENIQARSFEAVLPLLKTSDDQFLKETYDYFDERCDVSALASVYHRFLMESGVNVVSENHMKKLIENGQSLVFEGAQGALLDPRYGFSPYVTKTPTTSINALSLLEECGVDDAERVGILRAYHHRHGNGPFVTEDSVLGEHFKDGHNGYSIWEGDFRLGWFDLLMARYALLINKRTDFIALSCLDQLSSFDEIKVCVEYEYQGEIDVLDKYSEWRATGRGAATIISFKIPDCSIEGEFAKILLSCRPSKWRKFPGWKTDIGQAKCWDDLPTQAKNYVSFLSGAEGMNTPIRIIAVGAGWRKRFFV